MTLATVAALSAPDTLLALPACDVAALFAAVPPGTIVQVPAGVVRGACDLAAEVVTPRDDADAPTSTKQSRLTALCLADLALHPTSLSASISFRFGLIDAASLCEAVAGDIKADHIEDGRVSQRGRELASIAIRCAGAIEALRALTPCGAAAPIAEPGAGPGVASPSTAPDAAVGASGGFLGWDAEATRRLK